VTLTQKTDYPWEGRIQLTVKPAAPTMFTVRMRLPGWAQGRPVPSDLYAYDAAAVEPWTLRVNGAGVKPVVEKGYISITREWRSGDAVELDLPMPVHAVSGHPLVAATRDRVAFERGPVVYCVEDLDRKTPLADLTVPASVKITPAARPDLLGGVTVLAIDGVQLSGSGEVGAETTHAVTLTAIPYFAWNNRGLAPMAVWLRRAP
jgi:DUF1680 family protein